MDIYKLLGTFWEEHERASISKSATGLYFRLLYEANKNFWKGPIVLSWAYLGRVLGLSPETLGRAISDLKSRGLITYERSGKHAAFWFPDHFDNRSEDSHHFDNRSGNRSENRSENRSGNRSEIISNIYNTRIQEYSNTNTKDSESSTKQELSATTVAQPLPPWYLSLDERKKDIIDTWQAIVGPFKMEWLPLVDKVLGVCYPAQVKNCIVTLARTKAEVMQEQGFLYVVDPLLHGVFGKRSANRKKQTDFRKKLSGLQQFLEEGDENAG